MQLTTTKLLPETKRLAKQQAAARGMFLYEYLAWLVRIDVTAGQPDATELIQEFKRLVVAKNKLEEDGTVRWGFIGIDTQENEQL